LDYKIVMNIKILLVLLVLSIAIAMGCSSHQDSKGLVGTYCFNRFSKNSRNDSLFVNNDNKYKHKFWASNGQVFEASGVWKYDSVEQEIQFMDFMFFNDYGSNLPPGNWFSKVLIADNGEIRLMYSSENNIYFMKVK